jgi:hypothetical protein
MPRSSSTTSIRPPSTPATLQPPVSAPSSGPQSSTPSTTPLTGSSSQQQFSQALSSTPSSTITALATQSSTLQTLQQSQIGQKLSSGVQFLHQHRDTMESVGDAHETFDGIAEKLTDERTGFETQMLNATMGHVIAPDTLKSVKDGLENVNTYALKPARAMAATYEAYQNPSLSTTGTAALRTFEAVGGESTVKVCSSLYEMGCHAYTDGSKHLVEDGKKLLEATHKFGKDVAEDSPIPSLLVGSGKEVLKRSVPFLSAGTAVVDTGVAGKDIYDAFSGAPNGSFGKAALSTLQAGGSWVTTAGVPIIGSVLSLTSGALKSWLY